jgi:hypothetical protein
LERRRTQLRQALPAEAGYSWSARKNDGSGYGITDREVGGRRGKVVGEERVVAELVQRGDAEEVQEGRDGGEVDRVEAIVHDGELEALLAKDGDKKLDVLSFTMEGQRRYKESRGLERQKVVGVDDSLLVLGLMLVRTDEGVIGDSRCVGFGELDVNKDVENRRNLCCGRTKGGVVFPRLVVAVLLLLG